MFCWFGILFCNAQLILCVMHGPDTSQNGDKSKTATNQNGDNPIRYGMSPFWICRRFGCCRFRCVAVLVVAILVVAVLDVSPFWLTHWKQVLALSCVTLTFNVLSIHTIHVCTSLRLILINIFTPLSLFLRFEQN